VAPLVKLLELELGFQGLRMDSVLIEDSPLAKAQAIKPDAIVIGAVIPTPELYNLLEQLRAGTTAKLLFVNGSANEADTAMAMQLGADDAISRPFLPEALGMHIRSMLAIDPPEASEIHRGVLTIDHLRRIVWKGEMRLVLGTNEWGLILALARAPGTVKPHELLVTVWGEDYAPETSFLAVWIERLRINLGEDPQHPEIVLGDIEEGFRLAD
jgi:two-component system KDP operon response regulator KdpE